jgi:hypothetical protein
MPTIRERVNGGFQQQAEHLSAALQTLCSIGSIAASLPAFLSRALFCWPVFLVTNRPVAASCFKNIAFRLARSTLGLSLGRNEWMQASQKVLKMLLAL